MGARRIPNVKNEKIISLMSMGKTSEQAALAVGVSGSYCNKLYNVVRYIANEQWDELIEYSRVSTTGGVIAWACKYLDTQLPQEVAETIEAVRYRGVTPSPTSRHAPIPKYTDASKISPSPRRLLRRSPASRFCRECLT